MTLPWRTQLVSYITGLFLLFVTLIYVALWLIKNPEILMVALPIYAIFYVYIIKGDSNA